MKEFVLVGSSAKAGHLQAREVVPYGTALGDDKR